MSVQPSMLSPDNLFAAGGLLDDRDGDTLPDAVRACLVLGPDAGLPEHLAAVDLAARLGFGSMALHRPLVAPHPAPVPSGRIPVHLGRPDTIAPSCPLALAAELAKLAPGMGLVAVLNGATPAVLIAGADAAGLARAVRAATAPGAWPPGVPKGVATGQGGEEIAVLHVDGTAGATAPAEDGAEPAATADPPGRPPLRSLAGLYGPAGCSVDGDGDLLPDLPRTTILLPDDLSPSEVREAAHLGARLGLESLGLILPLAHAYDGAARGSLPGEVAIRVDPLLTGDGAGLGAGQGELQLQESVSGARIVRAYGGDAAGREAALAELATLDCWTSRRVPALEEIELALQRLCALVEPGSWMCAVPAALEDLPAQALSASAEALRLTLPPTELPDAARAAIAGSVAEWAQDRAPGLSIEVETVPRRAPKVVLDHLEHLSWEVDEAWSILEARVLPALARLAPDAAWWLDIRLSEPEGRRRQIRAEILQRLRGAGNSAAASQVRVLPAYHQGRAWLLEEVAPRLAGRDVAAIAIRARRFTAQELCLELPMRWLQDLHPVDELLGERLNLPREAVSFDLADDLPATYVVEARDAAGAVVLNARLEVVHGRRHYLAGFPEWGHVHPPTGCVRLLVDDRPIIDQPVAPDPERLWNAVQAILLPRLRDHVLEVTHGTPRPQDQPFFENLTIDAWLSEDDLALGVREERFSPLESLHEDLYFMLLDYCTALLSAAADQPYLPPWVRPPDAGESPRGARLWTAPGLIVPRIHRRDGGAGRVRFRMAAAPGSPQLSWSRGEQSGTIPLLPVSGVDIRVVGLQVPARRLTLAIDGNPEEIALARSIVNTWSMLRAQGTPIDIGVAVPWTLHVQGDPLPAPRPAASTVEEGAGESESGTVPAPHRAVPMAVSTEALVPWDRVLGLSEIAEVLTVLDRSPHIHVYRAGRSAHGRPSYAIEATLPREAGIWSRAKLCAWRCTALFIARHHANEASSTSALLRLAALLATDPDWQAYLKRVNVVIIPCENPDGTALHEDLQGEHATWMLHAGRYNGAGLEFVSEYANPLTPHAEALVLPSLFGRWAPDIVCDDHGFPSHEWGQLFAGHGNPWFRDYCIAQGLFFSILPRVAGPRYPLHGTATDEIRRRLVRAMADDPEIRARNAILADRYRLFLHNWAPDAFPAPYEEDVLMHVRDYNPDVAEQARASYSGYAGRYPGVTTLSMVTEVADETAQGRYMALCAHAQLVADIVLLDYLYEANAPASVQHAQRHLHGGATLLTATRPRPVLAPATPSPARPRLTVPRV